MRCCWSSTYKKEWTIRDWVSGTIPARRRISSACCKLGAASGRPIIHVQHDSTGANSPFRPGQPGNEVKPEAQPLPGEPVVRKCVSSAFIGTDLEQRLRAAQQKTLVVVGMMAEYCVNTTARMAENLGFDVLVVADATAAWEHKNFDGSHLGADEVYRAVMATLHDEFGQVVTTDAVLAATQSTVVVAP